MREKISTASEIIGASSVTVGIGIIFGAGAACVVGGILLIAFSYLVGNE